MFYYGQDTWRITPKFTLNYGLRWEVYFPEYVNGKDKGGFANLVQGLDRVAGEGGIGLNGNINNAWARVCSAIRRCLPGQSRRPSFVWVMGAASTWEFSVRTSATRSRRLYPCLPPNWPKARVRKCPRLPWRRDLQSLLSRQFPQMDLLPVSGPNCYQNAVFDPVSGQNTQLCVQPHIRPTTQRLPTLDAWNATVQRQVTNTTTIEVAYIGNKGTHVFAGDGPTYNVNNPSMVGYCGDPTCAATLKTPQVVPSALLQQLYLPGLPRSDKYAGKFPGAPRLVPGVLQCCSTDQNNYLGNDASSKYDALPG